MKLHSFDVYDTVLTRRVADQRICFIDRHATARRPIDFRIASRVCRPTESGRSGRPADRARRRGATRRDLRETADACSWNAAQTSQALEIELRVESQNTQAVPGMAAAIQRARAEGFQVMFLSDMYLPGEFITELLRREGCLQAGDTVMVSSEERVAKHDGRVFPLIRTRHPDLAEWRHTGDNLRADVEMPRQHGIKAQLETRCGLTAHERYVRGSEQPGALWRSQYAAALKLARLEGWAQPNRSAPSGNPVRTWSGHSGLVSRSGVWRRR